MNAENNELTQKLKSLGFEKSAFETKSSNRFIVSIEDIPSHVIQSVDLPVLYKEYNDGDLTIKIFNAVGEKLEEKILELLKKDEVSIRINLLTTTAEVDTTWIIVAKPESANFGKLNWDDSNIANIISVEFVVKNVNVSY